MVAWKSITRSYWYNSSIGIPLETVSVVVTKYNNTAVTKDSTVYGDINSVNVSTVAEAQSIATSLADAVGDEAYQNLVGVILGNATEGASGGLVYPTPYLAIDGFQYISLPLRVDGCPLAKMDSNYPCTSPLQSLAKSWVGMGGNGFTTISSVSLTSTYYQVLDADLPIALFGIWVMTLVL